MLIEKNDGDHFRVFFVASWGYSFELYSKLWRGLGLFLRETVRGDYTEPAEGVYKGVLLHFCPAGILVF